MTTRINRPTPRHRRTRYDWRAWLRRKALGMRRAAP